MADLCILFTLSVFIAFNELTFIFYQLCIHKANQIKGNATKNMSKREPKQKCRLGTASYK